MDYFVWALRNSERIVVVEVGCRRGRTFLRCPSDGLRLIGIIPANVQDVIITHMHYDHVGNLSLFPNARSHIQDEELAFVTGRAMTYRALNHSFRVDDVVEMVRLVYGGSVVFHNGEDEIFPGITVHHTGGHTRGLQSVKVQTRRGWVLFASDAVHYYESFLKELPFQMHESSSQMLESYRHIRALAPSDAHIMPGHDLAVLTRYPAPSPDLTGIVVLLDVDPSE
jgi:glyoxylase-like metal-dependent hydrolase (beta-lactamase superfamily II)